MANQQLLASAPSQSGRIRQQTHADGLYHRQCGCIELHCLQW
jgi:hypothetical protein